MKNIFTILAISTTILLASSCKKDDECNCEPTTENSINNNLSPKGKILSNHTWKMTGLIAGGADVFDMQYKDCEKDNIHSFKANYEYVLDEGATKCFTQAPQSQSSSWTFIENENKLKFDGYTYTIIELTDNMMILEIENRGTTWIFTYTPQ